MGGWIGEVPDPLGSPYSDCLILGCVGRPWSLSREEFFFPVLLPRPEAMAQWVPGVFLDTLGGKELTSNQGSSKRPEDDLFSHILLLLETPTLS